MNRLSELFNVNPATYRRAFEKTSVLPPSQWETPLEVTKEELPVIYLLYEVHKATEDIRTQIRKMGELAEVPIEPPEQTSILDETVALPGVIGGGVPGAGGYDALWVLIINFEGCAVSDAVQRLWSTTKNMRVTPLKASEAVGCGVRVEAVEDVGGLDRVMETVGWKNS